MATIIVREGLYDLPENAADCIAYLQAKRDAVPPAERHTATFVVEGGYDDVCHLEFSYTHVETEEELALQVLARDSYERQADERERQIYLQLKAKYEPE